MSKLLFQASWQMVGLIFVVAVFGVFVQYLLSGGKVNQIKATWENYILSIVLCAVIALFFRIPGGIFIVAFLISIGADKYVIPKMKAWFVKPSNSTFR